MNKINKINIDKSGLNWEYDISLAKFHFDYYKRLLNKIVLVGVSHKHYNIKRCRA